MAHQITAEWGQWYLMNDFERTTFASRIRSSFISCINKCNGDRNIRGYCQCKISSPMWLKGPRETLSKSTFVNLICFIWYQGLSVETTISGFRATWIYLRDKIKCSTNRFHPQLLKHYEHWVPIGKLEYIIKDLATSIKTLLKFNPCQETGAF